MRLREPSGFISRISTLHTRAQVVADDRRAARGCTTNAPLATGGRANTTEARTAEAARAATRVLSFTVGTWRCCQNAQAIDGTPAHIPSIAMFAETCERCTGHVADTFRVTSKPNSTR